MAKIDHDSNSYAVWNRNLFECIRLLILRFGMYFCLLSNFLNHFLSKILAQSLAFLHNPESGSALRLITESTWEQKGTVEFSNLTAWT